MVSPDCWSSARLIANIGELRTRRAGLRTHDDERSGSLTAVEVAAPVVPAGFVPDRRRRLPSSPPGRTWPRRAISALPRFRSPNSPTCPLRCATGPIPCWSGPRHSVRAAAPSPGCRLTPPLLSRPALAVKVFPGRTLVMRDQQSSSVKIYLRRFAPAFGPPRFALAPGHSTNAVHFPVDRAPRTPWHLLIVPGHGVATCLR